MKPLCDMPRVFASLIRATADLSQGYRKFNL